MTPPPRSGNVAPSSPPQKNCRMEEVLMRVRRTDKSSAGRLSGSNYKTMQAWFSSCDSLGSLAALFNRIAADCVPAPIVPLLTAGRGAAIPRPSGVGLRPVVVGNMDWTRQAVGQQHNNNTPAPYVLEVRRAVAPLLLVNRAGRELLHLSLWFPNPSTEPWPGITQGRSGFRP